MIRIQPQFASSSIEILNQLYPLERFRHVKRIRRISEESKRSAFTVNYKLFYS